MFSREYERPPYRPPSEAGSLLFRVVRGCPWNRCTFCAMYRDIKFQVRPLQELLLDIDIARQLYGPTVRTAFLGDSDPLLMKRRDLLTLLNHLYSTFPSLERVTAYARMKTILKIPSRELSLLVKAGLTRLHFGLESGSSKILERIKKGPTPQEMVEGTRRARETGFQVSLYLLIGIGGEELSKEQAIESAKVINQGNPDFLRLRTLYSLPMTPLWEAKIEGSFKELSPLGRLLETRSLVEGIEVPTSLFSDHVTNLIKTPQEMIYRGVKGRFPHEKNRLLKELDKGIGILKERPYLEREVLSPSHL